MSRAAALAVFEDRKVRHAQQPRRQLGGVFLPDQHGEPALRGERVGVRGEGAHESEGIGLGEIPAGFFLVREGVVGVEAVAVNVVRVDAVAAERVGEGDAALDELVGCRVLDVEPALLREFGPEPPEEAAVRGRVPGGFVVAVAGLDEAGVEVADDEGVGVLSLS